MRLGDTQCSVVSTNPYRPFVAMVAMIVNFKSDLCANFIMLWESKVRSSDGTISLPFSLLCYDFKCMQFSEDRLSCSSRSQGVCVLTTRLVVAGRVTTIDACIPGIEISFFKHSPFCAFFSCVLSQLIACTERSWTRQWLLDGFVVTTKRRATRAC